MTEAVRRALYRKPTSQEQLALWVEGFISFNIHQTIRCNHRDPEKGTPHSSQLAYVWQAFSNEYSSAVVIAARNAGKSYAAAIVCLLDCWFKPGIKIAVAAFQRNQSDYIYVYLQDFVAKFEATIGEKIAKIGKDEITFTNGSSVKFFSGGKSQAGIKGYHPNVLIVDECDLFSSEQFDGLANALEAGGSFDRRLDVLSTNYSLSGDGVVLKQIERYEQFNTTKNPHLKPCRVFRICLLDILAQCDDRFHCFDEETKRHCPLWRYCKGTAKQGSGFYKIESALETMRDSSLQVFESQMLLLRPSSDYAIFGGFSIIQHVLDPEVVFDPKKETFLIFDFGGKRCPHAALLVQRDRIQNKNDPSTYYVIAEFEGMGLLEYLIDKIKMEYPEACRVARCYCDPSGARKEQTRGAISYKAALRAAGFYPTSRPSKRKPGFEMLKALIEPASGPPRLLINKRCKHLIQQIQAAEYKSSGGKPNGEPDDNGKDDLLDCLRYAVSMSWGTFAKHSGSDNLIWFSQ
jgi:hypothetical protein